MAESIDAKKEIIPGDSGFHRINPAPRFLTRRGAIIALIIIVGIFLILSLTDLFRIQ